MVNSTVNGRVSCVTQSYITPSPRVSTFFPNCLYASILLSLSFIPDGKLPTENKILISLVLGYLYFLISPVWQNHSVPVSLLLTSLFMILSGSIHQEANCIILSLQHSNIAFLYSLFISKETDRSNHAAYSMCFNYEIKLKYSHLIVLLSNLINL